MPLGPADLPDHKICIAKALNEIPDADVKQRVQLQIKAFLGPVDNCAGNNGQKTVETGDNLRYYG
ncbi:MAG: hypothetical protein CFH05_01014 [Alphaproteobacteria bacterium MarineAlpha3_Bin4]|nr:MAG: hypothetical protein CFH05_01014 [Alphaproteobacteria bacterium MarineAlpha3_Bin4]